MAKYFWRALTFVLVLTLVLSVPVLSAEKLTRVRLSEVVRSVFYAPQYVAIANGFFEDEGLEIDLSTAWGADKGAAALISGSVEIGFFGPEAAVYIYQQGAEDHIIGFAQLTAKDGSFFMAREPMPDFKWTDVKGKVVVGARKGGVPQMMLEWILRQHGVDPAEDVEMIQNLAFTAAAGAFQSGVGDFIAQFEPTMSQMEKEGVGKIVASLGVDGGDVTYTVYHARKSYMEKNPDILVRFSRAIHRGLEWVLSHSSEEIVDVIMPFFPNTDKDILVTSVERYRNQGTWPKTPVVSKKGFEHLLEIIMAAGELEKGVPFEALMNNEFALKASE